MAALAENLLGMVPQAILCLEVYCPRLPALLLTVTTLLPSLRFRTALNVLGTHGLNSKMTCEPPLR